MNAIAMGLGYAVMVLTGAVTVGLAGWMVVEWYARKAMDTATLWRALRVVKRERDERRRTQ